MNFTMNLSSHYFDIMEFLLSCMGSNPEIRHFSVVWEIVLMYALTAHQATTSAAAALASDRDICSRHAEREDTPEHPVNLSVSKLQWRRHGGNRGVRTPHFYRDGLAIR